MTTSEQIERIAHKQPLPIERDVTLAVGMMLERMLANHSGGGRIEIRRIGSFSLHCWIRTQVR